MLRCFIKMGINQDVAFLQWLMMQRLQDNIDKHCGEYEFQFI